MEGEIGAGKIVDKLILPNEESALGGNGIIDGGSKTGLRAVEGAYPATVDVQLQGSRVSGSGFTLASAPTSCLAGRHLLGQLLGMDTRSCPQGTVPAHREVVPCGHTSPTWLREAGDPSQRQLELYVLPGVWQCTAHSTAHSEIFPRPRSDPRDLMLGPTTPFYLQHN